MKRERERPLKCPTCRKAGAWFDGDYGPFCSKRCRLIDLGKWLGGEHVISEPLRLDHFAGFEEGRDDLERG
ncbi:MAG TPA: DNA gyrase inhibitor YacG [Verrucomicrobiales bacterium]|nr:DNA gyrase inhibitor YacG [Verrucomicrobiales bacterium]